MIEQKLYQCATCNMDDDGYCICEPCIINCHKDHVVFQTKTYEEGFCDCGEEGSKGIRSCKMLKGRHFSSFQYFSLQGSRNPWSHGAKWALQILPDRKTKNEKNRSNGTGEPIKCCSYTTGPPKFNYITTPLLLLFQ